MLTEIYLLRTIPAVSGESREAFLLKIKVVAINARFTHSSLALFYLRNELEKHLDHVAVEICQYTINDPHYVLLQRLATGNPDYIFFSALIWNSDQVEKMIEDLLVIDDRCRFVVGGPQAGIVGRKFKNRERVTIFQGDIEAAGSAFYHDLQRLAPAPFYRGSFLKLSAPSLDYPYRPEDFAGPLKNRHIYYETSRGCPFSCSYCLSSAETGLFHKDFEQVRTELDDILAHEPKVVRFLDRTFNDHPKRALKIWQYLKEKGGNTLFHFEIAPHRFTDEMLVFLEGVEPGRFQFEIGIQSTNPETLKRIGRKMDVEETARIISRLRSMENIHLHADLILGLPAETEDSFARSFNDVFAMRPHYIQMGLLKILPDTPISLEVNTCGYRHSRAVPYSVVATAWLTAAQIRACFWFGECVEICFNNRYFITFWDYLYHRKEDMFTFFRALSERFLEEGCFWKGTTQETLSRLLQAQVKNRQDYQVLHELLCYDWLRCGHRFLPKNLHCAGITIDELRRKLYRELPGAINGLYDQKNRKHFFKKGVFYLFSRESLAHIGYEINAAHGIVRFGPEREENVFRLNQVCLVSEL